MELKEKLLNLVNGKKVQICTHWDADGVTSAAIIYHLIKGIAESVKTKTKGMPFLIEPADIGKEIEVVICTDINPSEELMKLPQNLSVIYIDHHPCPQTEKFTLSIHDENSKSTSLLIYNSLLKDTDDPYMVFLVLVGYFGDCGSRDSIPKDLLGKANALIPNLMRSHDSLYHDGQYFEIEKYVPSLNAGKRMNWSGEIPLELLKNIDSPEPFVKCVHPLAVQLKQYCHQLRQSYNAPVEVKSTGKIDYIIIEDPKNVQGVLAAKNIGKKPIMVINLLEDEAIGSMRCPENLDFDVGEFLNNFSGKLSGYLGGGHKEAGGFTLDKKELSKFMELVKGSEFNMLD
ncbi:MAG: DHH family phosphoesterase [Candidatus Woesearchaeota archaeon]